MPLTVWLAVPFVGALLLWPVRRARQVAAPVAALIYLALAVTAPMVARSAPIDLLGRSLNLSAAHAPYVCFLAVGLALLMAGGAFVQESALVWPGSLGTFGFLVAALCAGSAQLAGAMLSIAVIGVAFCLLAPNTSELGMRTVIVLLCGTLMLLLAGWTVEASRLEHPLSVGAIGRPAALFGMALLLGLFPFGFWAPPLGRVERPTGAFLAVCALGVIASLRMSELSGLAGRELLPIVLRWGGLLTFCFGAVGALLPRRLCAVVGYAAMADLGVAALAMGAAPLDGVDLAAQHLAYRAVACAALWVAARVLSKCFGSDDVHALNGAFSRAPLTLTAVLLAGMSLSGLPPMAGFASRNAILGLTMTNPWWSSLWAMGTLGPVWGLARIVIASWGPTPPPGSRREPVWLGVLLLAMTLFLLVAGVLPNVIAWMQGLAS